MKKYIFFMLSVLILLAQFGCSGTSSRATFTPSLLFTTKVPGITPSFSPTPSRTVSATLTVTQKPTSTPRPTPTLPIAPNLSYQCLDVKPSLFPEFQSSGVVVLDSLKVIGGRLEPATYLLDMRLGQISLFSEKNENQRYQAVSPNRQLLAYLSVILTLPDGIAKEELVIADMAGQRVAALPWEDEWIALAGWAGNQQLIISFDDGTSEQTLLTRPAQLLAIDPFTGNRQVLQTEFRGLLDRPEVNIPTWDYWYGILYDPNLRYVIYPAPIEDDDEYYTYALWDTVGQRLIGQLDQAFVDFTAFSDYFPMPVWSPDGTSFILPGPVFIKQEESFIFDLYRVDLNGKVERLTYLDSLIYTEISDSRGVYASWSPDGRYIAYYLTKWGWSDSARVAVLDTLSMQIKDYCFRITIGGKEYGGRPPIAPVWSPDGKQILVVDWYEKHHQRVILVDLEQGLAGVIAEDVKPTGWMLSP